MGHPSRKKDLKKEGQAATVARKPSPEAGPSGGTDAGYEPVAHDFGQVPVYNKGADASVKPGDDPLTATATSTILTYRVDKTGHVLGFNIDKLSKAVFDKLLSSDRAKIMVHSYYPRGDTDFETAKPGNDVANALIQWIGKKRIPNIEERITSDYGDSGPQPADSGGRIEIEVFYSPVVQSTGKEVPGVKEGSKAGDKKKDHEVESSLALDPMSGTVETLIEVSWDSPIKVVKEFKATLHFGPKGFSQLETDLAFLKEEFKLAGPGNESKLTVSAGLNFGADLDRDARQRLTVDFSAALKAALELELDIHGLPSKPSLELSGSIDHEGKPKWELQITLFKWK